MLDVKKLERRWLKYKIKKQLPLLVSLVLISLVAIGTATWINYTPSSTKKTPQPLTITNSVPSPTKAFQTIEENITVLEPSMEFVQSFESSPVHEEIQKQPVKIASPAAKTLAMPELPTHPSKGPPAATYTKPISHEGSLSINRNDSKLDIEDLKQRFKETSNANLGLFIARYYYDHENYNESYNYALKTNAINSRIDESWIIFSKSLIKLGKIDQAKKTLQLYISQSNSESARTLLDSIERGASK